MSEVLAYVLIGILFVVIIFFLVRTILITITMFTEVPYLPSRKGFKKALEYLNIQEGDNVIDIGSGDGRVLIYASRKYQKANFLGIEKNLPLVVYSNILKWILGRRNLKYIQADVHKFDLSQYNKIYMYLLPKFIDSILLEKKKELKSGCTIVSFHFPMGYKFSTVNKISKYPVKYRGREENIFKWINK